MLGFGQLLHTRHNEHLFKIVPALPAVRNELGVPAGVRACVGACACPCTYVHVPMPKPVPVFVRACVCPCQGVRMGSDDFHSRISLWPWIVCEEGERAKNIVQPRLS